MKLHTRTLRKNNGQFAADQRAFMRYLAGLPKESPARRFRQPGPFSGEATLIVVAGLNAAISTRAEAATPVRFEGCERISRLIELLQRAHSLLQTPTEESRKEFERLLGELNNLSRRYKWSPGYQVSETGLSLSWQFPEPENWEANSVWWIRQLVEAHAIHRLRRCLQCQTWFYAATEHQRFCVEKCRKKHASGSPVFKEKRRRYMAEVYRPRERGEEARRRRQASRASSSGILERADRKRVGGLHATPR